MKEEIENTIQYLSSINKGYKSNRESIIKKKPGKLQKVLIANRGEIAKRFFLSLREEGIPSVAIVTEVDLGQSWYEFADEYVNIGNLANYTNIPIVVAAALLSKANAIYPGYGFLSENPEFVRYIKKASQEMGEEIIFMGPDDTVMDKVGEKLAARALAKQHGVPLFEGTEAIQDYNHAKELAANIGYPVIVKLSSGGGGKGMMPVFHESELFFAIESAKRIGKSLYNDETFYLEKYITKPVHMEVQIFNGHAIGLRKCAVQRRNQKVVEETGDAFIDDSTILSLLAAAENMARISGYANGCGAGTVEFLYDMDSGKIGFLEMNTRLQVEHPVTDQSLGIDLAKWQILFFDGRENEIDYRQAIEKRFSKKDHAIECRIYAEDPENNYTPSPGKIEELELPTFNGTRCDFGFKKGDSILPYYDPMIGKVITRGPTRAIAIARMERALSELYIKGVTTNINQLLLIMRNQNFLDGNYSNRILDENPNLEIPEIAEWDATLASVFSSICEFNRILKQKAEEAFFKGDIEKSIYKTEESALPSKFGVEIGKFKNTIQLFQTGHQNFHVFLNSNHIGEAEVKNLSESEYYIRFGLRSYNVRVDNRPGYSIIRLKNYKNKINYYRLKVYPEGIGTNQDPIGMVRAPFQGSFVKFARDEHAKRDRLTIGSFVKKGDPVLIISAMKMETIIHATCTGKITYLIEDGDLSRLQIGETPQGQIIGKNISEGEVLFIVQPDSVQSSQESNPQFQTSGFNVPKPVTPLSPILEYFISENTKQEKTDLSVLLSIYESYLLGYSQELSSVEKAIALFSNTFESTSPYELAKTKRSVENLLQFYLTVKKIYAPSSGEEISLFTELNEYLLNWNQESYNPSVEFAHAMRTIFYFYGIDKWHGSSANSFDIAKILFYLHRAYFNIKNDTKIFENICKIGFFLSREENHKGKITNLLRNIYHLEESDKDNSKAEWLRQEFFLPNQIPSTKLSLQSVSRKYYKEFKLWEKDPAQLLCNAIPTQLRPVEVLEKCKKSLAEGRSLSEVQTTIKPLLTKIQKNYEIYELYSPIQNLYAFLLKKLEDPSQTIFYLIYDIGSMEKKIDTDGRILSSPNTEYATILSSALLKIYHTLQPNPRNQIDILANSKESLVDLGSERKDVFQFDNLFQINMSVNHFLKNLNVYRFMVHILCKDPISGILQEKTFQLSVKNGTVVPDLAYPNNPIDIYSDGSLDPNTIRLLARDKWPIEFWAKECMQPNSVQEIQIPSIDQIQWKNPKTGKEEYKPVGAKIFLGLLGTSHALFFMKDSRINGGATGDLEGLKYIAALYLAYQWKIPIYVWNDGAGANIREGMISLNRAGQGFMMNSLIHTKDDKKFYEFTHKNSDKRITELCKELDEKILKQITHIPPGKCLGIAVGIGSSTGLDVYGSSQLPIQIMLDHEESYRVLTGSNVIQSVTGEKLTNYQIGGAPVMGKWTGTVDLVADNKLHLLRILRDIQNLFQNNSLHSIQKEAPKNNLSPHPPLVISEKILKHYLDNNQFMSVKANYHGSGSLIGGFSRLGGIPMAILATRTDYGIRSFASITKAKELVRTSNKLHLDILLIFGKRWFFASKQNDPETIQARKDFLDQYRQSKQLKIHIVTDIYGLERAAIHSLASVVIYSGKEPQSPELKKFLQLSATFHANGFSEAFQIAREIIDCIRNPIIEDKEPNKQTIIQLPQEPTQSFDMMETVILPLVDKGKFIEFYKDWKDPMQGPSLITGLARIGGKTVGIIADQPIIMGGAPDSPGTEKFRIFTEFCNRHSVPILMLSNAPGFLPGTKQERLRIQQVGAESLDQNILGEVPVVSIVINQNYGGRQIHAFSKALRPGIYYMAYENSIMAVMGANASFDLFMGKKYNELIQSGNKEEAITLKENYTKEFNAKSRAASDAYNTGILDKVLPSQCNLRKEILIGLEKAEKEAKEFFGWRMG